MKTTTTGTTSQLSMLQIEGKTESIKIHHKRNIRVGLTAIMTLSWNIRGDIKTQNMSYTKAQLSSAVATCRTNLKWIINQTL